MSWNEDILEVSRLVLELTLVESDGADLDLLLDRLFQLLAQVPSFCFRPQGAILLFNPRHERVVVACHGLPAFWQDEVLLTGLVASVPEHCEQPVIADLTVSAPMFGDHGQVPLLILPMKNGHEAMGEVVLFLQPSWQPTLRDLDFMSHLARGMSNLVSRCMVNETLKVREIELEEARTEAIRRLGTASEYRDNETGMHVMRMTNFAMVIGKAMGLTEAQREMLYITAPMHDVGKIGIADAILLKPGRLTVDEFDLMKTHTSIGERILKGSDSLIVAAREIAVAHHEHWDGSGYPLGLAGEEIPILARICAIADVFDALTSARPYKEPWPLEQAVAWIHGEAGKKFDPAVVAAFDQAMPEMMRIRALYRDDIIDPSQILNLPETETDNGRWVRWDNSLSVGIDTIDEHHRYLFRLTNDLYEVVEKKRSSREVAKVLTALEKYAQVHFRAEEKMMDHFSYVRAEVQRQQHLAFEEKLKEFSLELHETPLTARYDVLAYLRNWLIQHIRNEDTELGILAHASP